MTQLSKTILRIIGAIGGIALAAALSYTYIERGTDPQTAAFTTCVYMTMWYMIILLFIHIKD